MIDMTEWKTFLLAVLTMIGTFWLIHQGILPADDWWKAAGIATAGYVVRTVAAKKYTNGGKPNAS